QLVEEEKLRLSDPLSLWFPDFPNAKAITLDHLLTHTSGSYSFQADPAFRARSGYQSPEELIAVAVGHGNGFCPGEYWSYSNTGYVLLGRIVEGVEGRPFHAVVNSRIVDRLHLGNARALAPREEPEGLAIPNPSDPGEQQRRTSVSTPYAAGAVVSSAEDLVRFWHGLLCGRLLKTATVRDQFQRLYPMFGGGTFYGRGVMLYDVPGQSGVRAWLGHSGGAPGTKALVAYAMDSGAFIAVLLNADGSAEATAHLLLSTLQGAGSK
ncbi:MAG: beta-lactamase family protein, partial [Verrucomicrobia bacterium]|nr:beta-lactamase family protein [Verrucomicrobiota bacterium]